MARFIRDEARRNDVPQKSGVASENAEPSPQVTESPAVLRGLVERGFVRRGLPVEDAAFAAGALVEASLRGVDTHGLRLLPTYFAELTAGRARARPDVRWRSSRSAARVLDANGALGLVAGRIAAEETVRLAQEHGVGVVSVCNSNHFGPAAAFTMEMARRGMIGIVCSNSDALVAAANGKRATFGTNPLSMAVLGEGNDMFCADFATSQTAYSRLSMYAARGWSVPTEWVVDAPPRGSPAKVLKPLGGHKGQCLAMMVEVLSALLSGGPFGQDLTHLYTPPFDAPREVSHFFLALDPAAFGGAAELRRRVSEYLTSVRAEENGAGLRVMAPGDPEASMAAIRSRTGIPLHEPELGCIRVLMDEERLR